MTYTPTTTCWMLARKALGMDILRNGIVGAHHEFGHGVEVNICELTAMERLEAINADPSLPAYVLVEIEVPTDELLELPAHSRSARIDVDGIMRWARVVPGERWTPLRAMQDPRVGLVMELSIEKIRDRACPVASSPWRCDERVTVEMVEECLRDGRLAATPPGGGPTVDAWQHAARIAWLIENGWDDPIEIDVGLPELDSRPRDVWPIEDGNHRLFAAIMRGDEAIFAVVGGDLSVVYEMHGDAEPGVRCLP